MAENHSKGSSRKRFKTDQYILISPYSNESLIHLYTQASGKEIAMFG